MCSKNLANVNVPLKSRKYLCIKIKSQNKDVGASVPRGNEPCQSAVQYNVVTNLNRHSHMYNVQAPNVNFQEVILSETSRKQLGKFTNRRQKRRIGYLYQYFPYIQLRSPIMEPSTHGDVEVNYFQNLSCQETKF
jgi:hypothetical protein